MYKPWCLAFVAGSMLFQWMGHAVVDANGSGEKTTTTTTTAQEGTISQQKSQSPRRIITLAESIKSTMKSLDDPEVEEVRRQYWRKTLQDIKRLSSNVVIIQKDQPLLSQWKRLLDLEGQPRPLPVVERRAASRKLAFSTENVSPVDVKVAITVDDEEETASLVVAPTNITTTSVLTGPIPRFEGFPSWERMLQDWADEVQEYMQQVEKDSGSEYMLANYGRPLGYKSPSEEDSKSNRLSDDVDVQSPGVIQPYVSDDFEEEEDDDDEVVLLADIKSSKPVVVDPSTTTGTKARKNKQQRVVVVPAPLVEGELALPHTDLSDKSKRIEIVTTAALPWKTGTAVNPLLRAAYMLDGRKERGGSVTLMLPWLERRADQERVYGTNSVFETPQDQESYIRTWLRESANMPEASEDLRIRWYTAWQNKVENSIYSMGDITALIPAEDVDICILEEPEHMVSAPNTCATFGFCSCVVLCGRGLITHMYPSISWLTCLAVVFVYLIHRTGIVRPGKVGPRNSNMSWVFCIPIIFSTPWTNLRPLFVLQPCVSFVRGCVELIVTVSSNYPVR